MFNNVGATISLLGGYVGQTRRERKEERKKQEEKIEPPIHHNKFPVPKSERRKQGRKTIDPQAIPQKDPEPLSQLAVTSIIRDGLKQLYFSIDNMQHSFYEVPLLDGSRENEIDEELSEYERQLEQFQAQLSTDNYDAKDIIRDMGRKQTTRNNGFPAKFKEASIVERLAKEDHATKEEIKTYFAYLEKVHTTKERLVRQYKRFNQPTDTITLHYPENELPKNIESQLENIIAKESKLRTTLQETKINIKNTTKEYTKLITTVLEIAVQDPLLEGLGLEDITLLEKDIVKYKQQLKEAEKKVDNAETSLHKYQNELQDREFIKLHEERKKRLLFDNYEHMLLARDKIQIQYNELEEEHAELFRRIESLTPVELYERLEKLETILHEKTTAEQQLQIELTETETEKLQTHRKLQTATKNYTRYLDNLAQLELLKKQERVTDPSAKIKRLYEELETIHLIEERSLEQHAQREPLDIYRKKQTTQEVRDNARLVDYATFVGLLQNTSAYSITDIEQQLKNFRPVVEHNSEESRKEKRTVVPDVALIRQHQKWYYGTPQRWLEKGRQLKVLFLEGISIHNNNKGDEKGVRFGEYVLKSDSTEYELLQNPLKITRPQEVLTDPKKILEAMQAQEMDKRLIKTHANRFGFSIDDVVKKDSYKPSSPEKRKRLSDNYKKPNQTYDKPEKEHTEKPPKPAVSKLDQDTKPRRSQLDLMYGKNERKYTTESSDTTTKKRKGHLDEKGGYDIGCS